MGNISKTCDLEEVLRGEAAFSASRSKKELHILEEGDIEVFEGTPELRPLHNGSEPAYGIKREKYQHRIIAYLKSEGKSNVEIAAITGYTPITIGYICRQSWFEESVLDILQKRGGDKVEKFIQEQVLPAAQTLAEVMNNSDTPAQTRVAAANSILDRRYGKPNQPMTLAQKQIDVSKATDDEINNRLSELRSMQQSN